MIKISDSKGRRCRSQVPLSQSRSSKFQVYKKSFLCLPILGDTLTKDPTQSAISSASVILWPKVPEINSRFSLNLQMPSNGSVQCFKKTLQGFTRSATSASSQYSRRVLLSIPEYSILDYSTKIWKTCSFEPYIALVDLSTRYYVLNFLFRDVWRHLKRTCAYSELHFYTKVPHFVSQLTSLHAISFSNKTGILTDSNLRSLDGTRKIVLSKKSRLDTNEVGYSLKLNTNLPWLVVQVSFQVVVST